MYYAAGWPSSQVFGPTLVRARDDSRLALTFDDGPSESTPAILEALAQFGARATFFQVGENAERLPEIARQVAAAGHEIGNHTHTHPRFYLRLPGQIAEEVRRCQQALTAIHGAPPRLFRPPYGARWFGMFPALGKNGLKAVMWSLTGQDWKRDSRGIARRLARCQAGDVVVLHDGVATTPGNRRQATVQAVRTTLRALAERGIRSVTVSELFGLDTSPAAPGRS
jgi:peptidoglycan/xylan/chitin deacetylase (PgdA/CDA1 family)